MSDTPTPHFQTPSEIIVVLDKEVMRLRTENAALRAGIADSCCGDRQLKLAEGGCPCPADVELDAARKELAALRAWKESAMAVEREWDAQAIATLLGAKLGDSCRAVIGKRVSELLAENVTLRADKARLDWLAARSYREGGAGGYSPIYVIANSSVWPVASRALFDEEKPNYLRAAIDTAMKKDAP